MNTNNLVLILVAGMALFSSSTYGAEPDFFIDFTKCKSIVAPLRLNADQPLNIVEGDPTALKLPRWRHGRLCSKRSGIILCEISFNEKKQGHKGNAGEYEVTLDIPPLLHFKLNEGNEYISVNTAEHTAVMSSLILDKSFAGSKVCHGLYLTYFEYKNLLLTNTWPKDIGSWPARSKSKRGNP